MSHEVAAFRGLVESLASTRARTRRSIRVGAEYDDLVQEGLIAVWVALRDGEEPTARKIRDRMSRYVRMLASQIGPRDGIDYPERIGYDELLPLDTLRVTEAQE